MEIIRVAIVVRSRLDRDGLAALLHQSGKIATVEATTSIATFESICIRKHPRVAIVDLAIRGGTESLFSTVRELMSSGAVQHVVFLDDEYDVTTAWKARSVGSSRYITRSLGFEKLLNAVITIVADDTPENKTNHANPSPAKNSRRQNRIDRPSVHDLTSREIAVLKLLADGKSIRESATTLGLAPSTVDNYKTSLMRKLKLHKATHLVRFAIREGLIAP